MPVYNVDIQKLALGQYITNRYQVLDVGIAEAVTTAQAIVQIERAVLPSAFYVQKLRVSTPAPADNVFYTQDLNEPGLRTSGGESLPLFVRFRVDLGVPYHRPLRKFLIGVTETDTYDGKINDAALAMIDGQYAGPLVGLGVVCSPSGLVIGSAHCQVPAGMHQLRRGSKRQATPVI